ncbi:ATP-dependent Clp protease ATP-binding subunit ClpX-like [Saccostrea cucullata]|uniref:ATP-dependent Clp protease ATP-binding subunit ClpX-like n=1 Tax=Saccostrea cuccullata TaxID=36930 RepID=UPI002ED0F700
MASVALNRFCLRISRRSVAGIHQLGTYRVKASGRSPAICSHHKGRTFPFSTSAISGRRKTYTYYGSAGGGNKKGGSGSKGHTMCPHCGYTMFHKDTTVLTSVKCENCNEVLFSSSKQDFPKDKLMEPAEIVNKLNQYIIGQDHAKKVLAVAVYNHYKRINQHKAKIQKQKWAEERERQDVLVYEKQRKPHSHGLGLDIRAAVASEGLRARSDSIPVTPVVKQKESSDIQIDKTNILMLGPTGTGKTYIAQVLSEILNVPIVICDCTSLTQAGYVGEDVENVVGRLLQNAKFNVEKCQQGIVFLDEVDKISSKKGGQFQRDVGGEGVQQSLLKMMEGAVIKVPDLSGSGKKTIDVDTTNILFIFSGAFSGLTNIIQKRANIKPFGFTSDPQKDDSNVLETTHNTDDTDQKKDEILRAVEVDDLVNFGMIPEFIGRIPVFAVFENMTTEMLIQILKEPKNALIPQYETLLEMDGAKLKFEEEALVAIAEKAKASGTGARALRSRLESILLEPMYETPDSDIEEIIITKETVVDKKPPVYIQRSKDLVVSPDKFIIKQTVPASMKLMNPHSQP